MLRVVLDTNVIISALLFGGKPEKVVRTILAGDAQLVMSSYIIEETARILRNKFEVEPELVRLLSKLLTRSQLQSFDPWLEAVADEVDNRILETAVAGKADVIVTGDKMLLELESFQGIAIQTPAQFLEKLKK